MHESESVKIVCVKYFDIFTASTLNLNLVPTLPTKELTCFCEIEDNSVAAALCTLYSTYIYIGTYAGRMMNALAVKPVRIARETRELATGRYGGHSFTGLRGLRSVASWQPGTTAIAIL